MARWRPAILRVRYQRVPGGDGMASAGERKRRSRAPSPVAGREQCGNAGARRTSRRCVLKYALINPNWSFEGSIYFGCREPHLPLEFGYSKALLEAAGHDAVIIDGQLENLEV